MLFQASGEQSEKADAVVENKSKQVFLFSLILSLTFLLLIFEEGLIWYRNIYYIYTACSLNNYSNLLRSVSNPSIPFSFQSILIRHIPPYSNLSLPNPSNPLHFQSNLLPFKPPTNLNVLHYCYFPIHFTPFLSIQFHLISF